MISLSPSSCCDGDQGQESSNLTLGHIAPSCKVEVGIEDRVSGPQHLEAGRATVLNGRDGWASLCRGSSPARIKEQGSERLRTLAAT